MQAKEARDYIRKAGHAATAVGQDIAPDDSAFLFQELSSSRVVRSTLLCIDKDSDSHSMLDETLVNALTHVLQDLPFGERTVTLSTKETIKVPNACAASVRKSLQGLDYFSSSGAEAFDELSQIAETLGDTGQGMGWVKTQQQRFRESKRYLKSDYKVHISKSASVADHFTSYVLSDLNESVYQSPCDHQHNEVCDRCEMVGCEKLVLQEIDGALTAQSVNLSQGAREELTFKVKQAKNAILAWKSHLVRSVNQDAARLDVPDLLDESSVLLHLYTIAKITRAAITLPQPLTLLELLACLMMLQLNASISLTPKVEKAAVTEKWQQ
ncbi:uncharacterized protein LOC122961528 [Acropora millepora]|uniref:uncharacterized protein LOC122961528 n=1 Tax=Acropora millepora TaxID=45264 RepID=UPI001CF50C64|nr:uncharacterized protein LOC122961528 [Acropora millepora]